MIQRLQLESEPFLCVRFGTSNRNESINSKYAVKANKMTDFRCAEIVLDFVLASSNSSANVCDFSASYTARVDAAVLEHNLGGKRKLHERICTEFVKQRVSPEAALVLGNWDEVTTSAREKARTADGKQKKAQKKARKTKLLQRGTLRSGMYTYTTSAEQAIKMEKEMADGSGSETETDQEVFVSDPLSSAIQPSSAVIAK